MEIQNQKEFIRNYLLVIFPPLPILKIKSDGTVEKYDLLWRSDKMKHWVYDRVKPVFIEPETEYDQEWIEDHEGPLVWVFLGMKDANRSQEVYHMMKSNEQIFKKAVHTSKFPSTKKKSPVLGFQQDLRDLSHRQEVRPLDKRSTDQRRARAQARAHEFCLLEKERPRGDRGNFFEVGR